MRTIGVYTGNISGEQLDKVIQTVRQVDPDASPELIEFSIKKLGLALGMETDCDDACARLERMLGLVRELVSMGFAVELKQIGYDPPPRGVDKVGVEATSIALLEEILSFERQIRYTGHTPALRDFIHSLTEADWSSHLGEPLDSDANALAGRAADLPDENWLSVVNQANSWFIGSLRSDHGFRYARSYQPLVDSLSFTGLIETKLAPVREKFRNPALLAKSLELVIQLACQEIYYSDVMPTSYGVAWANWLLAGRIPCGWSFEEGNHRLIIA